MPTPTEPRERYHVPLRGGREYALDVTPADAYTLATGLLSLLRCSFEIVTPPDPADRARRARDRADTLERMRDDAARYAGQRVVDVDDVPSEIVREQVAAAYRAGWLDAPKPIGSAVRGLRGEWTP